MQRYFVSNIENGMVEFDKNQTHHILNVMRMHVNDRITCVFNREVYLCELTNCSPLEVKVIEKLDENNELCVDVTLLYCLPKGDKIDLVIQKACELGVKEIVIVQSERCVAKIKNEDKEKKLNRFRTIAKEASEQSKRLIIPKIEQIINYKDISKQKFDQMFIAYENEKDETFFEKLLNVKKGQSIGILIGAEGGFSPKEVEYAKENGYNSISLGKRILKSETAVFYALSAISVVMEGK